MKNKNEVVMTNAGKETEVHFDSVAAMEACGWKVKDAGATLSVGEAGAPDPENQVVATFRTADEQAQRDAEDAGAKEATAAQLKDALTQLGIGFRSNASKDALVALYLSRP